MKLTQSAYARLGAAPGYEAKGGNLKRKDECLFCTKRKCNERVVSVDGGKTYDEIACFDHVYSLHSHSDTAAPGVMKHFISSTGKQVRGKVFAS